MVTLPTPGESPQWVGQPLQRREDARFLRGTGRYTDDVPHAFALHAAFVRSPIAFGVIRSIDVRPALEIPGVIAVLTSADLGHATLTGFLDRDEFVKTAMPILANERVRFVGEPLAIVIATSRYIAEDAIEAVSYEIDEFDPIVAMDDAQRTPQPIHDEAPDGVLVDLRMFNDDELEEVLATSHVVVDETFRSGRLQAAPMEGRGCLAEWIDRDDQLVVTVSTQLPHQVRTGIAQALGLAERQVRVIVPDVGGGFGFKAVLGREEVAVAAAARILRRPVRWAEDRLESLTASFQGREQEYTVRAGFTEDGVLTGLVADIRCNIGAYSAFPFTCGLEPIMAATEFLGVYKVPRYASRSRGIASNKPPSNAYRGVSRPQIVMVMEGLMDRAADRLGIDRVEIRRRNTIRAEDFPYSGPNGITYEPGSYLEALELCAAQVEAAGWRQRCEEAAPGFIRGIGIANFSERNAYGTATMGLRRMPMTPGFEVAHLAMDASGDVTLTSGTCSAGQGHETTFAQIVADRLGISPDRIQLRQGDTDLTSFGWGTFAGRSLVIGGGAAAVAARRLAVQLREVAAQLLSVDADDVELVNGHARVRGTDESISIDEIAKTVHFRSHLLTDREEYLLESHGSADPSGMFSNGCHAALVEIDAGTGAVQVLDYLVVEDCGVIVNPLVVDGQVRGGIAQGIGATLYEEASYSPDGQPLAGSFMSYLVPTAAEMPPISIHHLETPCYQTETGVKGMGEAGTIGAPAVILSALNDALRSRDAWLEHVPVTPADIQRLLELPTKMESS